MTRRNMVDRQCIKCGKRTRVQLERKGLGKSSTMHSNGRGRPRATEVRELPLHMPREAVTRMLRELNAWERRGRRQRWHKQAGSDKFVKASEIVPEGTKQYRNRIRKMDDEEWEKIESLEDFLADEWGDVNENGM